MRLAIARRFLLHRGIYLPLDGSRNDNVIDSPLSFAAWLHRAGFFAATLHIGKKERAYPHGSRRPANGCAFDLALAAVLGTAGGDAQSPQAQGCMTYSWA